VLARLGLPAERITVIPVGLGPEFAPTALSPAQRERYGLDERYVLYVGNFLPHKNLPRLLRARSALPAGRRRRRASARARDRRGVAGPRRWRRVPGADRRRGPASGVRGRHGVRFAVARRRLRAPGARGHG